MRNDTLDAILSVYTAGRDPLEWDLKTLEETIVSVFGELPEGAFLIDKNELDMMTVEGLKNQLWDYIEEKYQEQEAAFGDAIREVERIILLRVVDQKWMAHIDDMEQLRQGINLRAYAQRDPVVEYKFEAMDMFDEMIASIKEDTVKHLFHAVPQTKIERTQVAKPMAENHGGDGTLRKEPVRKKVTVGRNDPCPCGSGKKYKHCCLDKEQ